MVERLVRIQEVRGSIPLISTTNFGSIVRILPLFIFIAKSPPAHCEQAGDFYAVIGILSLSSIPMKNQRIFIFSSTLNS